MPSQWLELIRDLQLSLGQPVLTLAEPALSTLVLFILVATLIGIKRWQLPGLEGWSYRGLEGWSSRRLDSWRARGLGD